MPPRLAMYLSRGRLWPCARTPTNRWTSARSTVSSIVMTMQITVIKPADDFGSVLAGRALAQAIRGQIETEVEGGDEVVVDLAGVEAISPSFADELFAKMPPEWLDSGRIRFDNMG